MPDTDADFTAGVFYGMYLNIGLAIPIDGNGTDFAKLKKRLRWEDRLTIGRAHNNPILEIIMYKLEYKDGNKVSLVDNAIAETMFD